MHRRDVLKGLGAIPFTGVLASCEGKRDDKSHSEIVEVHLEGAIALVIQENKGNSLLAFSPRPKAGDEAHDLYFNGATRPVEQGKEYRFKLSAEGLHREKKPEINPGLNDFHFRTQKWRIGDSLVTIELPAPDKITFSGHRSPVTFKFDHRQAFMPTNHILKYEVKDASRVKLECSESKLQCLQSPDSYPGVRRFFFEIGPKRALSYEASHSHAISFFNYILHQSFPDLEERFSLAPEYDGSTKQSGLTPRLTPAVFQYPDVQLKPASYIIDCEFAGPLVSTSAPPQAGG